jgi:hypothetical protein
MRKTPDAILAVIERSDFPKATADDVTLLRSVPSLPVSEAYLEFITRYGYLQSHPVNDLCDFDYMYREQGFAMQSNGIVERFHKTVFEESNPCTR